MIHTYEDISENISLAWLWNRIPLEITKTLQTISLENTTVTVTFTSALVLSEKLILDTIILACPELSTNRILSKWGFRCKFTLNERSLIDNSIDPLIVVLRNDLSSAEYIDLDEPSVIQGFDLLIYKGILTLERKQEILS